MTHDDKLLARLAERARERDAMASDPDDSQPLPVETRDQLVAEILRRQRDESAGAPPETDDATPTPTAEPPIAAPLVPPATARPARRPWAGPVALAASILLAALVAFQWRDAEDVPLPGYTLELSGTLVTERSAEPTRIEAEPGSATVGRVAVGNRVEIVLRPQTAVEGPVEATTWRLVDGAWTPWLDPEIQRPAPATVATNPRVAQRPRGDRSQR